MAWLIKNKLATQVYIMWNQGHFFLKINKNLSSLDWSVAIVSLIIHHSNVILLPSYLLLCAIWSSWMTTWYIFQKAESFWSLFHWTMVLLYIIILVHFIQNQNTPQETVFCHWNFLFLLPHFECQSSWAICVLLLSLTCHSKFLLFPGAFLPCGFPYSCCSLCFHRSW